MPKIINPFIEFEGTRYYRDKQGWRASPCRGHERLHRVIWMKHHGPIPADMVVAYADGDFDNNDPSNFHLQPKGSGKVDGKWRMHGAERWPRERLEQVKALLDAGCSQNSIAKLMGCYQGTIHHKVRRIMQGALDRQPKLRRPRFWTAERVAMLRQFDQDDRLTLAQMAGKIGCSRQAVWGKLTRLRAKAS